MKKTALQELIEKMEKYKEDVHEKGIVYQLDGASAAIHYAKSLLPKEREQIEAAFSAGYEHFKIQQEYEEDYKQNCEK